MGKKSQVTNDFMIISGIKSFIYNQSLNDALTRATAYIQAGADAIMIYSHQETMQKNTSIL